jgi:C-terminal processing protease CtpA/Prc
MNRSGLSLSKGEPGAFTADLVRDGSPGAAAGVHVGDKIVAIDGRPASELSSKDAFKAVRGPPGSKLRLTILHHGQTSEVTVVLQEPMQLPS